MCIVPVKKKEYRLLRGGMLRRTKGLFVRALVSAPLVVFMPHRVPFALCAAMYGPLHPSPFSQLFPRVASLFLGAHKSFWRSFVMVPSLSITPLEGLW